MPWCNTRKSRSRIPFRLEKVWQVRNYLEAKIGVNHGFGAPTHTLESERKQWESLDGFNYWHLDIVAAGFACAIFFSLLLGEWGGPYASMELIWTA